MHYLYSRKILEEEISTDEEPDIIIATEELEGSAERYGNTFLLNWKQCAFYPLLSSSGHSKYMTMYYVSLVFVCRAMSAYLHVVLDSNSKLCLLAKCWNDY